MTDGHRQKDADDGPPGDIYWNAVPIWCELSHDELAERLGEEYACGFAYGFERALIMAMLKPEWVQAFYHRLRAYYLTTHTEEDLHDWESCAEETTQAIPMTGVS